MAEPVNPPYIVAEISANHLGDFSRAVAIIGHAADAGASAIKLQTFEPELLVGDPEAIAASGPWAGRKLVDLYREAWTPKKWHAQLFAKARAGGMEAFSSPFSEEDVDFLESIDCPRYKIASFEITDLALVRYAAATGKPIVLSTGMATLREIEDAVESALGAGARDVTVLKCTSGYPTPIEEANLSSLRDLADYFSDDSRIGFGLSDHTSGHVAAIVATALGAKMIEKHLTIRRADGGPDASFSAEPREFARMVEAVRSAAGALGSVRYGPTKSEESSYPFRRALYVVRSVSKGEPFSRENLRAARPGNGRALLEAGEFYGDVATRDVEAGTLFEEDMARFPCP